MNEFTREIHLHSVHAGADKVYDLYIEAVTGGGAYHVVGFNGRRNGALTRQAKTKAPVSLEHANQLFDSIVREKMNGDSHYYELPAMAATGPGIVSQVMPAVDAAQTDIFPQTANSLTDAEADEYLRSDDWWLQPKYDGVRLLILRKNKTVSGINKLGKLRAVPQFIVDGMNGSREQCLLDGELLGNRYIVYDILERGGKDLRAKPYCERYSKMDLETLAPWGYSEALRPTANASNANTKASLLALLRTQNAEGAIFRHSTGLYAPGRPARYGPIMRWKWKASASCLVTSPRRAGVHSIGLVLFGAGAEVVSVGNVTIPQAVELPAPGSIVEIEYLYAYEGGSLYQPAFKGVRDDVTVDECRLSQLKYKANA